MKRKTLPALPLVVLTGVLLCLDDLIEDLASEKESAFVPPGSATPSTARGKPVGGWRKQNCAFDSRRPAPERTDEGAPDGGGRTVADGYTGYFANGLSCLCPDDPYSKNFAELVLRQLEGRYFLGANGHLYLRATNQEHQAACRRFFPGPTGSFETWSWLAEIANFRGPEVWSFPREASHAEKESGEQWRGGFSLITRVLGREGETICRFLSHPQQSWGKWRPGLVAVGADGNLKNGRWNIQWRLLADRDRFVLANPSFFCRSAKGTFPDPIGSVSFPFLVEIG